MPVLRVNDIDMYYEEHGDPNAEPLVLIMGFGLPGAAWAPQIPALAPKFRLIVPDNRGAGRTSQPAGAYTTAQMADDVTRLLDELEIDSAHVVGQSMGGMIAQEFALQFPRRVRTLVLACTTPGGPRSAGYERMLAEAPEALALEKLEDMVTPERLQEFALRLFTPEFLKNPGPGFAQMAGAVLQFPQNLDGLKGQIQACASHNVYDRLPDITAQTLVITADGDPWIDPENSRILAVQIPNAELYIVQNARHGFTAEKPDETNRVILDFLARRHAAAA